MIEIQKKTKVKRLNLPTNKRLIFVSDIHGDIDTLKEGLGKVNFNENDYLFIIGDIYEKGDFRKNLETLRFVINLAKNNSNVFPMAGNCDEVFRFILPKTEKENFLYYAVEKKHSIINDIAAEMNYELSYDMDVDDFISKLQLEYSELYDFMDSLDDIIFINDKLVLVHGGIDDINNIPEYSLSLLKYDNFYNLSKRQDNITIVGHYPTRNYRSDVSCVNPIFDLTKNVISIDGGNHIVKGGQLNFVTLESLDSMRFSYVWVDHYPKYLMKQDVIYDTPERLVSVTFNDNEVEIVDIDLDYYLIKHLKTNTFMWVHSSFVYKDKSGKYYTYDASNQFITVHKNDRISIIKKGMPYSVIKNNGYIGLIDSKYIEDDF
ncbi:MAG: metallophosphoesterase [Anaeroplasma sp.]